MHAAAPADESRQSGRFLILYALAAAGGAVAYVPFLTVLLPLRVTDMVGDRDVATLGYLAFFGALAASTGHILFGWASDRTQVRRPWIVAGLALSCALLLAVPLARTPVALGALVMGWQLALNMMLAPLAAWAGDSVPDAQKGLLGGILSFTPALGALAGALVTVPGLAEADGRLWLVAALVCACVLPAPLLGKPRAMPQLMMTSPETTAKPAMGRRAVVTMWVARLLVQIAEAALFAYILFWMRGIAPGFGDNRVATLFGVVLGAAVPVALMVGLWSDRKGRPTRPLAVTAGIGACGLVVMALADSLLPAVAGYVVFGLASSVFLALHSAQTLRVLPNPATRGRDLGFFNLTNTIPSLVMPWLAIGMVPAFGFQGLFLVLSGLAVSAAVLLLTLDRQL